MNPAAVLIVEDEPDMRALIRMALTGDERFEVGGETSSAEDALELARTLDPGVIILDFSIEGELTGLQAAPLLKSAAPGAKILLFTAYDLSAASRREPAVDAYLRKDEFDRLVPTVNELLGLAG